MTKNKRILIVNKFYYSRGGDCIYSLNLERVLRQNGYEVAAFSMHYSENIESPYSQYFAPEVSFSAGLGGKVKSLMRVLGLGDVVSAFSRILDDFRPDVVHLNNIHSYISPVVAQMAKKRGCKVLWTLHDYKLICPSYVCSRNGEPCQLCFNDKFNVVRHRCMKGSLVASAIAYVEALRWSRKTLEAATDYFVCPSQFLAQSMAKGGFNPSKLVHMCNFIDPTKLDILQSAPLVERKDYALYVGRLSSEKGVETLLKAFSKSSRRLKLAGGGPLENELRSKYASCKNIEFLGMQDASQVVELLGEACMMILPSEWYENNPLSIIEALCSGTPVVGANIGGIPELITAECGNTFTSGNATELLEAVEKTWNTSWNHAAIKAEAIERFSPQCYIDTLAKLF